MVTSFEMLGMVGLFLLRIAVPIAITALIVYGLRRLDAKWQAEAEAEAHRALQINCPQHAGHAGRREALLGVQRLP